MDSPSWSLSHGSRKSMACPVLRAGVLGARWWVLTRAVGWAAFWALNVPRFPLSPSKDLAAQAMEGAVGVAAGGLAYGVVTRASLIWLIRSRTEGDVSGGGCPPEEGRSR